MSTITDVQTSHAAFSASLKEAIRRAAIQLPDAWRWVQYTNSWDIGNYSYKTDNRLESFEVTSDGEVLTVSYTYNAAGRIATTSYTSSAGVVTVTPTYDLNGNISATSVSVV